MDCTNSPKSKVSSFTNQDPLTSNDVLTLAPKRLRELHDSLSESMSKTPKVSRYESPTRLIHIMEKRFEKQQSDINLMMEKFEQRILKEFERNLTNVKLEIVNDVKAELRNELKDIFESLNNDINDLKMRIEKLESTDTVNSQLQNNIKDLNIRILQQENLVVSSDLRISGIPEYDGEHLPSLFNNICKSLNVSNVNLQTIYRVKNFKNIRGIKDGPIVAKLQTPFEKNYILKVITDYKRNLKKQLNLRQIGFESDVPFYIHENLTPFNHRILKSALRLKKDKQIKSVYTIRGIVYIKMLDSESPVCLKTFDELNDLFRSY